MAPNLKLLGAKGSLKCYKCSDDHSVKLQRNVKRDAIKYTVKLCRAFFNEAVENIMRVHRYQTDYNKLYVCY